MNQYQYTGTVQWSETDASGLFHFSCAMKWAENAEHALCREIDSKAPITQMPRIAVSSEYRKPFKAGDQYVVKLGVSRVGGTSISYVWQILKGEKLAVEGKHTAVHLSKEGTPDALPETLRNGLAAYLQGE